MGEFVRCPCGDVEDDGLMISCEICNTWQHAACFLIKSENGIPEEHICNLCDQECAKNLNEEELKMECLKRRAIAACSEYSSFTYQGLSNKLSCDLTTSKLILNSLKEDGLLTKRSNRWYVIKEKTCSFKNPEDVIKPSVDECNEKIFFKWDL